MDNELRYIREIVEGDTARYAWFVDVWLYRIVVNNALTRLKKRQRENSYTDIEPAAGQLEEIESSYRGLTPQEQARYIGQAMERLRPEDRLVLTLYYLDEQSLGEIAVITGISRNNVKMQLHRARGRMYGVLSVLLNRKINTL